MTKKIIDKDQRDTDQKTRPCPGCPDCSDPDWDTWLPGGAQGAHWEGPTCNGTKLIEDSED